MDSWDQRLYAQGYRNAEADIANVGIEYAIRHANNIKDDGNYVAGYRTAVGVAEEKRAN